MITPPEKMKYSFDTSGLIDGIERFYPIKNFPALWNHIDNLIDEGRFVVSEEAWEESISADAELKSWCEDSISNRERCIYKTDMHVAKIAGAIVQEYPRWAQQGKKNNADPFVIAVAEVEKCYVISGETNGGPGKPKIPYVCEQRGVNHVRFVDMVRIEGWIFT